MTDRHERGFKDKTRLVDALGVLRDAVSGHERTETVPLTAADGRVLAETVVAPRAVPHYERAAMDGYAVRAADTFGASSRSPEVLRVVDDAVGNGEASRVHTGSRVPDGADAVVMIEHVESFAGDLEVLDAVASGENVAPVGEDVEAGQPLYEQGHRLRPSDLGLLKSVGVTTVEVYEPPRVAVIPTGEELVETDPGPGEVVETNALTVTRLVERWGGNATYGSIVPDEDDELRAAVEGSLDHDVVVTTGGSSVGARDRIPEVVESIGDVLVHGVALKPGHPVALGVVEDTPVVMLPGYPVACIVNATQFLRPVTKWCGHLPVEDHPTTTATVTRKLNSEPGIRTFARVRIEDRDGDRVAVPTRAGGAGVLSSVALATGWVVIPESTEGVPTGTEVVVENWEWSP